VQSDGEILAFVRDARGAALHAAAGLELVASVHVAAGANESVKLAFDPVRKCFAGHAKGELSPGPIELSIHGQSGIALGRLERIALRVEPAHAGQVLVAGDYSLELVASGKELRVFAFDAAGKALANAEASLQLKFGALAPTNVALKWDPASLSFRGDFDGSAGFRTQPIRLALGIGGRVFEAAAASLQTLASAHLDGPKLSADGKLDARADLGASAKLGAGAQLKAPEAKASLSANAAKTASADAAIKVTPPKVSVTKSASASAGTTNSGAKAKASAGFSFGMK